MCVKGQCIILPGYTTHLPPRACPFDSHLPLSFPSFTTFFFSFPLNILSSSILPSLLSAASYPSFPSKFLFSLTSPLLPTDFPLIIPNTHLLGSWKDFLAGSHSWAGYNNQEGVFHLSLPPGSPLFPARPSSRVPIEAHPFPVCKAFFCFWWVAISPRPNSLVGCSSPATPLLNVVLAVAVKSESTEAGMGAGASIETRT